MSGIVGYIGNNFTKGNPNLLNSMSRSIQYVESDLVDQWQDEDLSISKVHHGILNPEKQPIFNEDKSLAIFMDGEIYDYEADKQFLIDKGHQFKYEKNDAEFCLHLYEQLAEESFIKLNGTFLIAIYDLRSKELILVNDRFSSYPLFFYTKGKNLIFGAQLKAVIESSQVPRDLNVGSIVDFFTFNQVLGTKTYYNDIEVMFPASILRFKGGIKSYKQYWEMNYREKTSKSKNDYIEILADAIKKAVARKTGDSHRYGILLSGGLDARGVLGACECPFDAYTIGGQKNFEATTAEKITKVRGCSYQFLQLQLDNYANIAERAVAIGDGMSSFQHGHFIDFLEGIRKKSDILFTGHALDILFTGYYLPSKSMKILNKIISFPELYPLTDATISKAILDKLYHSNWNQDPASLLSKDLNRRYAEELDKSVQTILSKSKNHSSNLYNRYEYFVYHFPFKHYSYLNVNCIQHHMEQRVPAFDNDLLDLHLEMPPEYRFKGKIYRQALQRLYPDLMKIPNELFQFIIVSQ